MPYEVRVDGKTAVVVETADEALAHVRHLMHTQPNCEPEVFDTLSGEPLEPAASRADREV